MRHSMKPDLRADYKIRLYTGPKTPFFEVSVFIVRDSQFKCGTKWISGPALDCKN